MAQSSLWCPDAAEETQLGSSAAGDEDDWDPQRPGRDGDPDTSRSPSHPRDLEGHVRFRADGQFERNSGTHGENLFAASLTLPIFRS